MGENPLEHHYELILIVDGNRIALLLVQGLGRRTIGLGYAITFSDLVLAPATPSNTARSGGTIYPIISNIPKIYGSEPGPTAGKIGTYVMWTAFATTAVTSSLFLTALAPNAAARTRPRPWPGSAAPGRCRIRSPR